MADLSIAALQIFCLPHEGMARSASSNLSIRTGYSHHIAAGSRIAQRSRAVPRPELADREPIGFATIFRPLRPPTGQLGGRRGDSLRTTAGPIPTSSPLRRDPADSCLG